MRWLRPDYQAPGEAHSVPVQQQLVEREEPAAKTPTVASEPIPWPGALADQAHAISALLSNSAVPLAVDEVAANFKGRKTQKRLGSIESLLETLVALGQAEVSSQSGDEAEEVRFGVV